MQHGTTMKRLKQHARYNNEETETTCTVQQWRDGNNMHGTTMKRLKQHAQYNNEETETTRTVQQWRDWNDMHGTTMKIVNITFIFRPTNVCH